MTLTTQLVRPPLPLLLLRFVRAELGASARRLRRALGGATPRELSLDELAIPDSALAQAATGLARACEPTFLFNHSVRSYLFGVAIGLELGLEPDRELLYVASVLHDLGLVPEHDTGDHFELDGARAAHSFALRSHVDERRAGLLHEAIALHTSIGIADSREPEIALVHYGAGLDVIGYRSEDVAIATREAVVASWPRVDLKEALLETIDAQVARKPWCHIAGHTALGFRRKVLGAPFAA